LHTNINASDYLQATSLTPYQHKHASCPSSGKKKQTRKQRKKRRILPSHDEPSWRGGLSGDSGHRCYVKILFGSDGLGSARTNYSGTWNPRNKMQLFV
jgi:hypothetical protein